MSTINRYGYSTKMNPKLKYLLENYKPEDKSDLTAMRNRKSHLWHLNTVKPLKMKYSEPANKQDKVNAIAVIIVLMVLMGLISSL